MLFVSFPSSSEHVSAKDRLDGGQSKSATKEQKPSVIIELLDDEKPYKVIEKQKECVDLASDNEKENNEHQSLSIAASDIVREHRQECSDERCAEAVERLDTETVQEWRDKVGEA